MKNHIRCFSSNSFSHLLETLEKQIESTSIGRKIIVVSGDLIKQKVCEFFLKERDIAFGYKVLDLASAMDYFSHHLSNSDSRLSISSSLLTMDITHRLERAVQQKRTGFEKIARIIGSGHCSLHAFAERISRVMIYFGFQRKDKLMLKGWVSHLWDELSIQWRFPNALNFDQEPAFFMEVHFFALPWVPPIWQKLIDQLGRHWMTCLYHFTPSREFWADNFGQDLSEEGHPLLSSYGKVDRMMFDFFFHEAYEHIEDYREVPSSSLLRSIQMDLLTLQQNEQHCEDRSILFQKAPTKMQEVEGLKKLLFEIFSEDSNIGLDDVQVFAPDISEYAPLIQLVFEDLNFQIHALPMQSQSLYLQAFMHLLSLKDARWSKRDVLRLLHFPGFTERIGLDHEDIIKLRERFGKVDLLWGYDREHRNALLARTGCYKEMIEKSENGTWKKGGDILIRSIAQPSETLFIDFSESVAVGKFIEILQSLVDDLGVFIEDKLTLSGWKRYLRCFADSYLSPVDEGSEFLSRSLNEMESLSDCFSDDLIEFSIVYEHLNRLCSKKSSMRSWGEGGLNFSSLKMGNVPPKKVIAVLGLQEGIFPEKNQVDPFIPHDCRSFAHDSDQQRLACLETLLKAEDYLLLSYDSTDPEDGQETLPSPFYRDLQKSIEGKGSRVCQITHAHYPFHPNYFKKNAFPKSFSSSEFLALRAQMNPLQKMAASHVVTPVSFDSIVLRNLCQLAKDPIRFHCQKGLGIYLNHQSFIAEELEREFELSSLDRALIVRQGRDEIDSTERLPLGLFREIAYCDLVKREEQISEALSFFHIDRKEIFSVRLSRHHRGAAFNEGVWCLPSLQVEFQGRCVHIEGEIGPYCSKGPVVFGRDDLSQKLKIWPLQLVWKGLDFESKLGNNCYYLQNKKEIPFDAVNWKEGMHHFLMYYERALVEVPSFHPALADRILVKGEPIAGLFLTYDDPYFNWLKEQEDVSDWRPFLCNIFEPILKEYERV